MALCAALWLLPAPAPAQERAPAAERGRYLVQVSGGCRCHTDQKNDGAALAGRPHDRDVRRHLRVAFGATGRLDEAAALAEESKE